MGEMRWLHRTHLDCGLEFEHPCSIAKDLMTFLYKKIQVRTIKSSCLRPPSKPFFHDYQNPNLSFKCWLGYQSLAFSITLPCIHVLKLSVKLTCFLLVMIQDLHSLWYSFSEGNYGFYYRFQICCVQSLKQLNVWSAAFQWLSLNQLTILNRCAISPIKAPVVCWEWDNSTVSHVFSQFNF